MYSPSDEFEDKSDETKLALIGLLKHKESKEHSAEKSDRTGRWAIWTEVALTAVGVFLTAATLAQTYFAWRTADSQAKIMAALSWHEKRLQEEQVVGQFGEVDHVIWQLKTTYPTVVGSKRPQFEKAVLDYSKNPEVSNAILFTLDFYEGVANCVAEDICDRNTTEKLFKKDIQEFIVVFSPVICTRVRELQDDETVTVIQGFYKPNNPICSPLDFQRGF